MEPYIRAVPHFAKKETIAAGFCCSDGIVLAADTLMTLRGGGKTYRTKLFTINEKEDSYLAYSGTEAFAKELVNELQQGTIGKTGDTFLKAIKERYGQFWREHYTIPPKAEKTWAETLITFKKDKRIHLYRTSAHHVYPVIDNYAVLGIGENAGESLFKPLYSAGMDMYEASYMAIYVLQRVKKYTEGCGGETEIAQSVTVTLYPYRGLQTLRWHQNALRKI